MCSVRGVIVLYCFVIMSVLLSIFKCAELQAQLNHSYPRVGTMHFGRNAPPEWYAKFDYLMVRSSDESLVREIKKLNPNIYIFGILDWNKGGNLDLPDEWKSKNSKGEFIGLYGLSNFFSVNMTDFCGKSSEFGNKRFTEYFPGYLLEEFDQSVFSGIATDGLWIKPRDANGDIDLNGNGVNDYTEFGEEWVNEQWKKGTDKLINGLRQVMGPDKPIVINSGRFHEFNWPETNGVVLESHGVTFSFSWYRKIYNRWMDAARKPHFLYFDGHGDSKNNFAFMRYVIGNTMFGDGYSSYSESNLHHYDGFYDEYEVDLGFPTGEMQAVTTPDANDKGLWARFFTKGAIIVNVDDKNNTVGDAQLRSLSGYAGPYYRIKGGQVPDFNNGKLFDEVKLTGTSFGRGYHGDAILLTKNPATVVTDIYVDNDDEGTAPGTDAPGYKGSWQQTNRDLENAWSLSYKDHKDAWAVAYSAPGSGSNVATFTPFIGVAGKYKVYEWHGNLLGQNEATNVPYEIRHASGTTNGRIDQRANVGEWNYLGEFLFSQGKNGYVRITNNANGVVLADAFKFVYSEGIVGDSTKPDAPTGVRVSQ